ncbi:substrate-binding region of ABC-type glycine betaine transport system [Daedalea quercina L-15889]|uniref:Substrate-binding region of ABC-type glycine betaine transport system n=1 Tax=Daedalea quercina L-15889 TaxID=1314783 RepID=A0A165MFX5_9APHY|nr:substrate-binding region of ABC-type glycine betaine transport system [Daedalea quercina L-15889]
MEPVTVVQGVIDLTFHQVVAAVIRAVLSKHGVTVSEVVSKPHEAAFVDLREGRTQILVGWLPGSHETYLAPFRSNVVVLGEQEGTPAVYDPYCIWGVPDYIPEETVRSITDLAKPEVAARFVPTVQGINPGAGISRFSKEIISRYGLNLKFVEGDIPKCTATFEVAYANKEWVIVPLWHPQYLHAKYNIRALEDPDDLLRAHKPDAARVIVAKTLAARLSPETVEALRRLRITNAGVARMDYLHAVEGLNPDEAAAKWIEESGLQL